MSWSAALIGYQERNLAIKELYAFLVSDCEKQVRDIGEENRRLISAEHRAFPDLNFQFFKQDDPSNLHFRVVSSNAVLVVVHNQPVGHIGSLIEFFNEPDLVNTECFYRFEKNNEGAVLVCVDKHSVTPVDRSDIVGSLLSSMFYSAVSPARIAEKDLKSARTAA